MKNHRHWCNLLPEMLVSIAEKLEPIDCIPMSNVCLQWHEAIKAPTALIIINDVIMRGITPIVDVHSCYKPLREKVDDNAIYKLPLWPTIDCNVSCIGSSHGWLVFINNYGDMHLFNPLSGVQIPLPSIDTLPFFQGSSPKDFGRQYMQYFVDVVLSAAPVFSKAGDGTWEFTVMMILGELWGYRLCFAKASENCWQLLEDNVGIRDVIMHSNNCFYTVNEKCQIEELEPSGNTFKSRLVSTKIRAEKTMQTLLRRARESTYLVETNSGELMVVLLGRQNAVNMFSWDNEGKWKKVKSLGQQVLFLGSNHSVCVTASECPELQQDTIYFNKASTDKMMMLTLSADKERQRCIEVFRPLKRTGWRLIPVWFCPTKNEKGVLQQLDSTDEIRLLTKGYLPIQEDEAEVGRSTPSIQSGFEEQATSCPMKKIRRT